MACLGNFVGPRELCGSVRWSLGTGKMVCLGNFAAVLGTGKMARLGSFVAQ